MSASGSQVEVYGVRHHGPGSARAVRAALEAFQPQLVLIEGPSDADDLLPRLDDAGTKPPLALFSYVVGEPERAAFWPFAIFSPEWQALAWARKAGAAAAFCDLPAAAVLAEQVTPPADGESAEPEVPNERRDPLAALANAAGYDDPERWWDDVVESRHDGVGAFAAIAEAMAELRLATPALAADAQLHEDRREAYMRTVLRRARREYERIAVVCGAWHVPAFDIATTASADAKLLAGLKKEKVSTTWIGWTHSRLAAASGYGAGVRSPGWYAHLFRRRVHPVPSWFTRVARVLRTEDLPVSSAHVIEATRLSEALASLRGRAAPGLAEVTEATRSVLCDGDDAMVAFVTQRLVVGEALGAAPSSAPMVPLEADLRARARTLRLKFDADVRLLELDLRRETDLERSLLLHRLMVLRVPWAKPTASATHGKGTFRETWTLQWRPELALALVDAARWGSTVRSAAASKLASAAHDENATLAALSDAVESALLADVPDALRPLLTAIDARAAADLDVTHLMQSWPALVRAARYGDVRGTDATALRHAADTLLVRICAALPAAVGSLDDSAAEVLRKHIQSTHQAVQLRDSAADLDQWLAVIAGIADRTDLHGLLAGFNVRMLRDAGRLTADDAAARLSRALSVGTTATAKAMWIEGFLSGGAVLLIHDDGLLQLIDDWLLYLTDDGFVDVLPLLRRTFGTYTGAERRMIAERVRHGSAARQAVDDIEYGRAADALQTVALLMGIQR